MLFAVFLLFTFFRPSLNAQNECGTPNPTVAEYAAMRAEVPALLAYLNSTGPHTVHEIPMYFTVGRDDDGTVPPGPNNYTSTTAGMIDDAIDYLNEKIAGGDLHFYRIGDVHYLDYNGFAFLSQGASFFYDHYNYVSSALNVHIRPYGTGLGPQPNMSLNGAPTQRNIVFQVPDYFTDPDKLYLFAHETGHVFTLLHTQGPPNPYNYPEVLTNTSVIDHPEEGAMPRELAIRTPLPMNHPAPFHTPNCYDGGDLLCDTQADCDPNYSGRLYFPKFDLANIATCLNDPGHPENCIPGCVDSDCIPHNGTYRDYNGDPVIGNTNNIMSYHHFSCNGVLTTEQLGKMSTGFNLHWDGVLTETPFNLSDKVEYKGSTEVMKNVTINWRHPGISRFTNSTSDAQGKIQGILYSQTVSARVKKLGSGRDQTTYTNDANMPQPYSIDKYNSKDWRDKLSVWMPIE